MQQENASNSKINSFGERLRAVRESSGLARAELAARIGLTNPSQISRYEAGKGAPTFHALLAISTALEVDLHWLMTGRPSPAMLASWRTVSRALKQVLIQELNRLSKDEDIWRRMLADGADYPRARKTELEAIQQTMKTYTNVLQWLQQDPEYLIGPDGNVRLPDKVP